MAKRLTSSHIWLPEETVGANARLVLPAMAKEYFAAGRKIVSKQPDPADLHPFRLATKRIRYTLEIFRGIYEHSLETLLEQLKPVQDALGNVNDCVATAEAFDVGKKFKKYLFKRGKKKAREFNRVWREEFDRPGREQTWIQQLSVVPETAPRVEQPVTESKIRRMPAARKR